jgi:hypothetical protein
MWERRLPDFATIPQPVVPRPGSDARAQLRHQQVKRDRQHAACWQRNPERHTSAQQRGDGQEHRQRGQDIPERRLGVTRHVLRIGSPMPKQDHAEHRDQRQRGDQRANGGQTLADLGNGHDQGA